LSFYDFSGFGVVVIYAVHEKGLILCSDELETLEFCDCFEEGVFDAAFVDEETFEDPGVCEITHGDFAAVDIRVGSSALFVTGIFGKDTVGIDVESAGTFESP